MVLHSLKVFYHYVVFGSFLALIGSTFSQQETSKSQLVAPQPSPLRITGHQMECHQEKHYCKLEGKAHVEKGNPPDIDHLYADTMTVYFHEDEPKEKKTANSTAQSVNQGRIKSIVIDQNVIYTDKDYKIECDHGVYNATTQRIELEGNIKIRHKSHYMVGHKGWVDLKNKKYFIEQAGKGVTLLLCPESSSPSKEKK